jgi:hypothetical protein
MGNSHHGTPYTHTASRVDLMEMRTSAIAAKGTTDSRRGQGAGSRVQGAGFGSWG